MEGLTEGDDVGRVVKKARLGKRVFVNVFVLLVVLGSVGLAIYSYSEMRKIKSGDQVELIEDERKREFDEILARVGELIELPENEVPAFVKVIDKERIADNQEFFVKAQNGDVVLVYKDALKAYIYRPSEHKLINVSSVTIESNESSLEEIETEESTQSAELGL